MMMRTMWMNKRGGWMDELTMRMGCVRVPLTHFSISPREPPSSSHKLTIQPPNYPPLARSLISPLHYSFKVHVCFNYYVLRSVLPS
jgi:hypothetical protein